MNRIVLALTLIVLILFSIIIAGSLLIDLEEDETVELKLYTFPIYVGDKTYFISVRTNWTSAPEDVKYWDFFKSVEVGFRGTRATVFCNIIIPADLIWGELSVLRQGYKQDYDSYTLSNNGTHHSVQMTFNHVALVEYVSIKGTEGIIESAFPTYTPSPSTSDSSSLPEMSAFFEGPLGGFGISSPSNKTYSSNALVLVVGGQVIVGSNVELSMAYSLDGQVRIPIPTEAHPSYPGLVFSEVFNGSVTLQHLPEGSHRIAVFGDLRINNVHHLAQETVYFTVQGS